MHERIDTSAFGLLYSHGKANRLSRDDPVQWQYLDHVEVASWKSSTEQTFLELGRGGSAGRAPDAPAGQSSAGRLIRQRRSALALDGETSIPFGRYFTMLARAMPRVERDLCQRPMPWDVLPWEPAIHLALFVHRVDGLASGLYVLARKAAMMSSLSQAMHREMAAQVSCGQAIAGDGAFSLGMIAEFESSLRRYGPWFYRRLFWETGVIAQVLYLEAEAAGVRATGIGCFFDDPVHHALGIRDAAFQSLSHFTTGGPVDDPRLTTLPP